MDHFLDYIFLSAIILGYSFLLPPADKTLALLWLALSAGFMVHTLMDFAITNDFKISISYFGVSEARCVLVIFNVILMVCGKGLLVQMLPLTVAVLFIALCAVVHRSQKIYAQMDSTRKI